MRARAMGRARWRIDAIGRRIADNRQSRGAETMRVLTRTVAAAAVLVSLAGMAGAAEIRLLSVGAVQNAVRNLAAEFETETGHRIVLSINSPAVAMQKIKAGEVHDAVID